MAGIIARRRRLPDLRFSARSGATISDLVRFTRNDRRRIERRNDSGMRENFAGSPAPAVALRSGKKKFFTASIVILVIWERRSLVLVGENSAGDSHKIHTNVVPACCCIIGLFKKYIQKYPFCALA